MNPNDPLRKLTLSYLGEDWDLYGSTVEEAMVVFAREASAVEVDAVVAGVDQLLASAMTEDELDRRWIDELHSGYDPRDHGMTYREFFAHARDVLRSEAAKRSG